MTPQKRDKILLAIILAFVAIVALNFAFGVGSKKHKEPEEITVESITKKMHFCYGAEDTLSLVKMQSELEENFPDAAELDTVNGYLAELRDKYAKMQAEWKKSFDKLKVENDEFEKKTWYYNPYFAHKFFSNNVSLYIGRKGDKIWPCARISYTGSDWIFFDEITFLIGEGTFTFAFDKYKNKDTEVSGGLVAEWVNMSIDQYPFSYIADIPDFDNAAVRMSGKYTKDRKITDTEKKAIRTVVEGYKYLLSTGCTGIDTE